MLLVSLLNFITKLKHLPWFEITILLLLMGINGHAAFSDAYNLPNNWFTRDDAYYYFKVAQNISEGQGSTLDGINPTNGYHPLWMMVCVPIFAFARFNLILPLRILILVLAMLRAATSILLYKFLKNIVAQPIAILGTLYWAFNYYIHAIAYQQGLETGLAAFCLVLFLFSLHRFERSRIDAFAETTFEKLKRIAILAISAILVTFSRLDLVFLMCLFGLWIVFRNSPIRYLLPLDILVLTLSSVSAFIIRTGLPDYYQYSEMAIAMLLISLVLNISLNYFLGLYEHPRSYSVSLLLKRSAIAIGISTTFTLALLLGLTNFEILHGNFPRSAPLIHGVLSFGLIISIRLIISLFNQNKNPWNQSAIEYLKTNWRTWLSEGTVYYGILGGALGVYMYWNKLTFGAASPVSGQIKRWWGSFSSRVYGGSARTIVSFFGVDAEGDLNAWHPLTTLVGKWHSQSKLMYSIPLKYDFRYTLMLILALITITLLLLINRKRSARITNQLAIIPLLAGSVLQILQYNITGYSALKEWYWVSQMILISLIGVLLLDIVTQKMRKNVAAYVSLYLIIIFWGVGSSQEFSRIINIQMPYGAKPTDTPYMEVATFVETHTESGSLIGMTGGGNVGYFIQDRTIVNMDGLINSYPYFLAHKSRQGSDFLYEMGLDYIFANPNFLEIQPYRGQYSNRLEIIDYYGGKAVMHFLPAP